MNLAEAMLELADDLERELAEHFHDPADEMIIKFHLLLIRKLVAMSRPDTATPASNEGVSVSIGGSSQPQQPPPQSLRRIRFAGPVDPWEEAKKKAPPPSIQQSDPGDEDDYEPDHP